MDQQFILLKNIRISYLIEHPLAGNTIYFYHGNGSAASSWEGQLRGPAFSNYRMIAFDFPAHGLSDPMKNGYDLISMSGILAEALLSLDNGFPYIMVGVSLGTNLVAEMLAIDLIKPRGIFLAGSCIAGRGIGLDKIFLPETHVGIGFQDAPDEADLDKLIRQAINVHSGNRVNILRHVFLNVKDNFRSKLGQSIQQHQYDDQIQIILDRGMEAAVLFGKSDKLVNPEYLDQVPFKLWRNQIIRIEEGGHWIHIDDPLEFNSWLGKFALEMFRHDDSI